MKKDTQTKSTQTNHVYHQQAPTLEQEPASWVEQTYTVYISTSDCTGYDFLEISD